MKDGPNNCAHEPAPDALLLFSQGARPDRGAIHQFADTHPAVSLTHDPAARPPLHIVGEDDGWQSTGAAHSAAPEDGYDWVELLRDGLTFDLVGLAPGRAVPLPNIAHSFDWPADASTNRLEPLRLAAGNHLAGAQSSLPVLRGMLGLARDLVVHFEWVLAVAWPPASSVIGRRFFESSVTAWLDGGAFPALGITAFRETMDGALQSEGLAFLIGQELRIEPALAADRVAATRLGVRLVNQLVLTGPVERSEQIIGPSGQRLQIEPSANRRFIRVRAG